MTLILTLIATGILALVIELFVPGGILGVAGGLCLIAGSVLVFRDHGFWPGLGVTLALAAFCVWLLRFWMRHFHRLPFSREMILEKQGRRGRSAADHAALAGRTGIALTDLSPSGYADCGGEKIHVITETRSIPAGAAVVFVRQKGPGWIVRPGSSQ